MEIIIASDIFGRTPELEAIATQLSSNSCKAAIIDPYEGKYREFTNESEAYSYFQQNVGIGKYKNAVLEAAARAKRNLILIGFSVGASAIWAISDKARIQKNAKAVCFYGSQIRNFTNVNPRIKIELIFPEHELHFDVRNMISQLSPKSHITCYTVPYLHGFMNKKSVNFNEASYHKHLRLLKNEAGLI